MKFRNILPARKSFNSKMHEFWRSAKLFLFPLISIDCFPFVAYLMLPGGSISMRPRGPFHCGDDCSHSILSSNNYPTD